MKQKIITGLILVGVFLPILYYGGWLFNLAVFVFSIIGGLEITNLFKDKWPNEMDFFVIVIILILPLLTTRFFLVGMVSILLCLFLLTVYFEWFDVVDATILFTLLMIITLSVKGLNTVNTYGSLAILYVAVSTYVTDTAAYFTGMFFGKHKLAPRISPNKTIEGALGGWIISSGVSFLYALYVIPNRFPMELVIIASILMPLVSQLGDLAFSSFKRHFKVKDFGHLFPEHGGVLDRIDSLLFNFMFFYTLLATMII
jgi:phosphatidate cytidylyltransferase